MNLNIEKEIGFLITDNDFETIELALNEPNIFSALSIQRMELRHSNFIGYLFDPNESHGLGDIVLKKFLRDIFSESKDAKRDLFDADLINLRNAEIRREWKNIDLLVVLDEDVIVIENKVDSVDHSNQLKRYKAISDDEFHRKNIHYVYLTPLGNDPQDDSLKEYYINYSYQLISEILDSIIVVHRNSISEKIFYYLSDYLVTIKRELLMNDKLNELAIKVYKSHKEALDFIFENMPDPATILYPYFENEIVSAGFKIGSKNKGYVRFTTEKLQSAMSKVNDGYGGWPQKEPFLFEINYFWHKKQAIFNAVISPNDRDLQNAFHDALKDSKYYKEPRGAKWIVVCKTKYKFEAVEVSSKDPNDIEAEIRDIVGQIIPIALEMSELLEKILIERNYKL